MFLSTGELRDLTGFARAEQQARWLKEQGIAHRLVQKRVIISRTHVGEWIEGRTSRLSVGPNWDALREFEEQKDARKAAAFKRRDAPTKPPSRQDDL